MRRTQTAVLAVPAALPAVLTALEQELLALELPLALWPQCVVERPAQEPQVQELLVWTHAWELQQYAHPRYRPK